MLRDFTWPVAVDGYRWEKDGSDTHLRLARPGGPVRDSQPLREATALFRNFADLKRSEETILAFANQHGHLGLEDQEAELRQLEAGRELHGIPVPKTKSKEVKFETRHGWVAGIEQMKEGLKLWDKCRSETATEDEWQSFEALVQVVLRDHTEIQFRRVARQVEIVLQPEPVNLYGALWLQFAAAVTENKQLRQCKVCSTWFAISPEDQTRTTRVFCSDACKSQDYRNRIQRAKELAAEGLSHTQIAKELGVDQATLERWLQRKRR